MDTPMKKMMGNMMTAMMKPEDMPQMMNTMMDKMFSAIGGSRLHCPVGPSCIVQNA